MNDSDNFGLNGPGVSGARLSIAEEPHPRAVGSPLPIGNEGIFPEAQPFGDSQRFTLPPPPGRALANSSYSEDPPPELPAGLQRAVNAIRAALPFVQRILPILDGNFGTAVSNMLAPHPHTPPPPPPVNLVPIEDGLTELRTQHRELFDQVLEQNSSLKRVEDQLELVREATDRNTLEQQELMEDLKGFGRKVNRFAFLAAFLLAASVAVNVLLYLHIKGILP